MNSVSFDDLWDEKLYSLILHTNRAKKVIMYEDSKKVSDDLSSDIYITLIIKSIFPEKERTPANTLWVQSVLETIFDEKYKSPKIKNEAVDSWIYMLTDPDGVSIETK
ncbi:217_t:CDS:2 [Funneliformis caledonium]|uniref:217_t:CDS:1 n=1 Tax=Funneliformis caledonium TaxID=1117310 RepID=A0A9N9GKH9_9GLOM|nr:217_t:CDS:2 [Funneliformis caledonium]